MTPLRDPTLACEVTLQPVRRYGVDAAVLFSDIVVPYHAIGFGVDVVPVGPSHRPTLRQSQTDLDAPPLTSPTSDIAHVTATIDLVMPELAPTDTPLIGFAGAPFTVASYSSKADPRASSRSSRA